VLLLLSQAVLFQAAYGLPAHRLNGRIQRLSAQIDHLTFDPQTGSVSRALEAAQRIAGHADSRTTKLYDRSGQKVLLAWRGFGIERQKRKGEAL